MILTGGNVKFPGFKERFVTELRAFVPDCFDINVRIITLCFYSRDQSFLWQVHMPEDPIEYAWMGASRFGADDSCRGAFVTRKEYLEYGHSYCNRRMSEW